jgi:Flp pilus assembly pilin Flp
MNKLISLWNDESGQDLAEYAMMIGLIALAVLVTVTLLGSSVSTTLMDIDTTLQASI